MVTIDGTDFDTAQSESDVAHTGAEGTDYRGSDAVQKGWGAGSENVLADKLVAHFPMHEDSGSTVYETVNNIDGTNNAATAGGATAFSALTAYTLAGNNRPISYPDAAALDLGSSGTIAAWIRLDTNGVYHIVNGDDDQPGRHLLHVDSDDITGGFRNSSDNFFTGGTVTGSTSVTNNLWHLVGVSYTGSAIEIWVDGSLDASASAASGTIAPITNTSIIGDHPSAGREYTGDLFEVLIADQAFTQSDWETLYNMRANPGELVSGKVTI
jgi:hypothetical protein